MKSQALQSSKRAFKRSLQVAFVLGVLCNSGCLLVKPDMFISVSLGFVSAFVPAVIFFYGAFYTKTGTSGQNLTTFFKAEGLKWLSVITLLALCFVAVKELSYGAFLASFVSFYLIQNILPAWLGSR